MIPSTSSKDAVKSIMRASVSWWPYRISTRGREVIPVTSNSVLSGCKLPVGDLELTVWLGGFVIVEWLIVEETSQVSWLGSFKSIKVVHCY